MSQKTILVVAAHPDDEMLGCGGTLARLRAAGASVSILLLGEGPLARREDADQENTRRQARQSALAAAKSLDIADVRFAGFPDNRFDALPLLELTQYVERVAHDLRPDLVFTHFSADMNLDHQLTHRAVMTAFRPLPDRKGFSVLSFEVPSSTEYAPPGMGAAFQPDVYVDIKDFFWKKQEALGSYASEMRPWPHPRSFEAVECLARLRGSQCGRERAEAFMLCRSVC